MSSNGRTLISALNKGDYQAAANVTDLSDLDIKIVNHYAPELFEKAIHQKNLKLFQTLIGIPRLHLSSGDYCPLRHAVQSGLANFLRELVQVPGINPNVADRLGNTALLYVVAGRWSQDKALEMLEDLFQLNNLKVNIRGEGRKTALHHAMDRKWFKVSEMLMKAGANPKLEDGGGQSPLMQAMKWDETPANLFTEMLSWSGEETEDMAEVLEGPDGLEEELPDLDAVAPEPVPAVSTSVSRPVSSSGGGEEGDEVSLYAALGVEDFDQATEVLSKEALLSAPSPGTAFLLHRPGVIRNLADVHRILSEKEEELTPDDLRIEDPMTGNNFWHAAAVGEVFENALAGLVSVDIWPTAMDMANQNAEGKSVVQILDDVAHLSYILQMDLWEQNPQRLVELLAVVPEVRRQQFGSIVTRAHILLLDRV